MCETKTTIVVSVGLTRFSINQVLLIKYTDYLITITSGIPSMMAEVLSLFCSGTCRCVFAQCQEGKTSEMTLEKQLLLPINVEGEF